MANNEIKETPIVESADVNIDENFNVESNLDKEPIQEIPLEEIVLNLGFWIEMVQRQGKLIAQRKFSCVVPKSE